MNAEQIRMQIASWLRDHRWTVKVTFWEDEGDKGYFFIQIQAPDIGVDVAGTLGLAEWEKLSRKHALRVIDNMYKLADEDYKEKWSKING